MKKFHELPPAGVAFPIALEAIGKARTRRQSLGQPPCEMIGAKWITDPINKSAPANHASCLKMSALERCKAIYCFSQTPLHFHN